MRFRTGTVLLATGSALGLLAAAPGIVSADSGTRSPVTVEQAAKGFKGLKHLDEPSPCRLDPGVTDSEIRIGGLVPTSGTSAMSYGPALAGIQARFNKANTEQELGVRRLVFRNLDTAANSDENTTAAHQLVEQERAFAIIEYDSNADASAEYLYQQGIPVVGWQLGLPSFGTYPNFFGWRNSASRDPLANTTTRQADVFKRLGARRIALVAHDQANSIRSIEQVREAAARKGLKVVYETHVSAGTTDFGAIAQAIKTAGADGLYTGMDLNSNAALGNALAQTGSDDIVKIFPGAYDPRIASAAGMDGAVFSLEFIPFELRTPGFLDFEKWMTQTDPSASENQITAVGWLMADALIEGIKAAGLRCPTRRAFIANLRMVDDYSANGFFDPVNYREEWNRPYPCAYYVQVRDKRFVPIFDGKAFCATEFITDDKALKRALQAATAAVATATSVRPVDPGG